MRFYGKGSAQASMVEPGLASERLLMLQRNNEFSSNMSDAFQSFFFASSNIYASWGNGGNLGSGSGHQKPWFPGASQIFSLKEPQGSNPIPVLGKSKP